MLSPGKCGVCLELSFSHIFAKSYCSSYLSTILRLTEEGAYRALAIHTGLSLIDEVDCKPE